MTAPKLWSERDFDECCYAVSGVGPKTMVCASPCLGSYCDTHRAEMAAEFDDAPRVSAKLAAARREQRRLAEKQAIVIAAIPKVSTRQILAEVALKHDMTPEFLKAQRGSRKYALPRQEAAYRLKYEGKRSLSQIAAALGLADHTSAHHACRKYEAWLAGWRDAA